LQLTITLLLTTAFCLPQPLSHDVTTMDAVSITMHPCTRPLSLQIRARVAYKGTHFAGFQTQQGGSANACSSNSNSPTHIHPLTVQSCLKQVDSDCLLPYNKPVIEDSSQHTQSQSRALRVQMAAAGRTDSGIHARDQAIRSNLQYDSVVNNQPGSHLKGSLTHFWSFSFLKDALLVVNNADHPAPKVARAASVMPSLQTMTRFSYRYDGNIDLLSRSLLLVT
jgi:hypothetical protein